MLVAEVDAKGDSSGYFRFRGLVLRTTVDAAEEAKEGVLLKGRESGVLSASSSTTTSLCADPGDVSAVVGVESEEQLNVAFCDVIFLPSASNS